MSHTTVPIRTGILNKLATAFEAIPEIKLVNIFHATPDDLMAIPMPALYLFEIQPEDRKFSNRLAVATMHLQVQVFINTTLFDQHKSSYVDFYELMDIIAARLHGVYHNSVGLSKNGLVNVVELQYDRIITNNSVGVLNSMFDVEYRHDRGNAFS